MIALENLSKSYDGVKFSVCEVSLPVPAGAMLVLLGGSGCGKTTTLKMINRLIEPSAGSIKVNNQDVGLPVPCNCGVALVMYFRESACFRT